MHIVLVGLNHRTAAVDIREQMALTDCSLRMALDDLKISRHLPGRGERPAKPHLTEGVILSTCNRLEIYAVVVGQPEQGWALIEHFLARLQGIAIDQLRPHLYRLEGRAVITHLMRVAAGLDSMILGEPQILGQVASALTEAQTADAAGAALSHLFDMATHAGKRARTETEIGQHTTSISHAAAQLVQERLGNLAQAEILVVGAGEMAEVAAHALQDRGATRLRFINRTFNRAEGLAAHFGGHALNWYHLPTALTQADVVVSATGAPHIVIHESDVDRIIPERGGRPLLIVDIAVPRDVEEAVGRLPGVTRCDIDQLQSTVDANLAQRQAAIPAVEAIIAQEAERFETWLQGRQVLPVLVELRRRARQIAAGEMDRNTHRLEEIDPLYQELVAQMVHRIINKLLHEPTVRLKALAAEGNGVEYAHAVRELFALDGDPTAPVPFLDADLPEQVVSLNGAPNTPPTSPSE
ncbi:MAG: glutamyl-tRNA reductase [Candidatus Promineifilaceae bacterium]|nr:glutamyl-tRNA reductase [Candidatus Promineifilaceae bacterium]